MADYRRSLPAVDAVLREPELNSAVDSLGHDFVKARTQAALELLRQNPLPSPGPDAPSLAAQILTDLPPAPTTLHQVINASGIIVHTNLGRAPLSDGAKAAIQHASGVTDVEMDLTTGRRAPRGAATINTLERVVGGASAHLVNNGAAAIILACHAMASKGNIILSRGEMVEIGDGFRIPELIESTGVEIREVGTTNRTHVTDYLGAIDEDTGFILKVHTSNFRVEGFTGEVPIQELATEATVPVVADIGSGLLLPHPRLPNEPDVRTTVNAGADLVITSGDKLLGGPQAGLMFGASDLIHRLRRHPLARALRVDKLTLAALEATVTGPTTPVARALATTRVELRQRAEKIAGQLKIAATVEDSVGAVGGGGAPGVPIESVHLVLPADYAVPLRTGSVPVVGHVKGDRLLIDLLAVDPSEDPIVVQEINAVASN